MTLGKPPVPAFLALWNDIDPSRIDEYERWHTLEHVPERVWVPGFRSGTRYVATRSGQPRYFTRYELDDVSALDTAAYQDLVDHPTPWSASMRPAFANFLRKPCRQVAVEGATQGAALLVLRVVWRERTDEAAVARGARRVLIDGAKKVVTKVTAGRVQTAGPQAMRNVDDAPAGDDWVFLIEATSTETLKDVEALAKSILASLPSDPEHPHSQPDSKAQSPWFAATHYRYASQVMHADVARPGRPSPRTELMPSPQRRKQT